MNALYRALAIAVISTVCCQVSSANEWRQFRGPDGQGHAAGATNLPTEWSETDNILWKAEIPGRGWSSPVFADSTIWLTTAIEKPLSPEQEAELREKKLAGNPVAKQMNLFESVALHAIGINPRTGAVEHNIPLFVLTELEPIHSLNSFASPSPVLDGTRLYCHFGELGTACVDTETNSIKWKAQLPSNHSVGPGSSPIVHQDLFIVPCDGTEQQYVIGLDKMSGEQVWKTKRPPLTGTTGDVHKSFSTPLVVNVDNRDQVIIPGAQWVVAYDPRDGYEIWRVRHGEGFSNVPRPVVGNGMAYICTGFMQPQIWAIGLDGRGDVSQTHVKFKIPKQVPNTPSPILIENQLYFISDQGVATSIDANTGEVIWTKRVSGNFSSSPLFADGKLYFCSHEGKTTIIRPGREYDEVAVNTLNGQLMASPAVLDESLLLRSQSHLYRVGIAARP
ncbi:outer membrane protein assembly factor BamB family protein [Schlesneria paludicola]|uniref:outer membrane protein assembly factor BamB family protein n=1 Tax=Schlesneria paludicola TaxID=360056 RepID=UPI00029B44FB|nr:PQQ-binding-like beta-propeller repeat protein [Schlesneria paludicola]